MKPPILMQTDFSRDESIAAMIGVVHSIDPTLDIFDGNHAIPPFNIWVAATNLAYLVDIWPKGTVFVSVVDPGVGTKRRGCVALLNNGVYIITPDNGTLTHMARHPGVKMVREIDMQVNRLPSTKNCNIFHGRDVFAYTAGRLAAGIISYDAVGPAYPTSEVVVIPYDAPACENDVYTGIVVSAHSHFGLVSSNIPDDMVERAGLAYGDCVRVTITKDSDVVYESRVEYQKAFGYVQKGAPILYIGSQCVMEITINAENMVQKYGIGAGPNWRISLQKI